MAKWRLNRLWFWPLVVVYFVVYHPNGLPPFDNTGLDNLLVIALALVVGARLADAGRSSWIGFAGTIISTFVVPLLLTYLDGTLLPSPVDGQRLRVALDLTLWIPQALLIAFLIWAGTRRPTRREMEQITHVFD